MSKGATRGARPPYVLIAVLVLLGVALGWYGAQLALLGGSLYYVLAGLGFIATAILCWRRNAGAAWLYAGVTIATFLWAMWETGSDPWGLMPRILVPAAIGVWFAMPWVRRSLGYGPLVASVGPVLLATALLLIAGGYLATRFEPIAAGSRDASSAAPARTGWTHFGGDAAGTRFLAADQINRDNVHTLELAWTYRAGTPVEPGQATPDTHNFSQAEPLALDDVLYLCTSRNVVIALDADTGTERWRFDPEIDPTGLVHFACRGVAHHDSGTEGVCASRLLVGTVDNRLLALDRRTGKLCPDFGTAGTVDLKPGFGDFPPGYHYPTSPPVIVGDVAVLGGLVFDGQSTDMPPGAIRGFDVKSGELLWVWDVVSPISIKRPSPDVEFRRSTANYWSVASADPDLGLVYVPTGNTAPDFYGGHRRPEIERYASAIVALEAATGDVRWSFQTVRHDIWDYDVGSQPVLVEFETPEGDVPALIAPTKRGEIFVLDRRTGEPLTEVVERPVPQDGAEGERLAPTQPFSTGFPSFTPADLTDADMWGVTPLDQLWCRLRFKRSRYDGQFTPQSTQGSIINAGSFGVIDWGSVSLDPERELMIVNTSGMTYYQKLIPREEADGLGLKPINTAGPDEPPPRQETLTMFPQVGTPFAIDSWGFLSPLGYPCVGPPWGTLAAVDLKTREVIWERPLGTTRDVAPLGLALPTGVFNIGGSVTTRGGVTFIAATIDHYLRAFDTETGRELWKARLPAGGQANPITYVSPASGRQYVVIAAGGHRVLGTTLGDYVVAYARPRE